MRAIFTNKYLRWAALLPLAMVSSLIIQGISRVFNSWQLGAVGLSRVWLEIVSGALLGWVFVWVGVHIAPTHKRQTAMVLFGLAAMLFGVAVVSAIQTRSDAWPYVERNVPTFGGIRGGEVADF